MTKPFFQKKHISSDEIWELAVQWVSDNKKLVRQIASPYLRHMAADSSDLLQEATIAAFKALNIVRDKERPQEFVLFFRVVFKTNCIKLSSGIQTAHCFEIQQFPDPDRKHDAAGQENHEALDQAFNAMTRRQREVCSWLLNQPLPVSPPDLAREFRISLRHAFRLISSSIERITMVQR